MSLAISLPATAHANVNNFVINSFVADETLTTADKQGQLHIVETINLTFSDYNHGILRAIPESYKGHKLNIIVRSVTSPTGAAASYTTYTSNGNLVLKIGDASRTSTGSQTYVIDYTVSNVITFYTDHDELYWDINGDQWQQPFEHVSVRLQLGDNIQLAGTEPVCYAGSYGTKGSTCLIHHEAHLVESQTIQPLNPQETLTIVVALQKGVFTPPSFMERAAEYVIPVAKLLALPFVVFIFCFIRWYSKGRDAKGRGTIVPQYTPADNLKPLEAGTILDFKVDNKDITATIIDLAIHGYIKIVENKQDRLIGKDKLSYVLELKNADASALTPFEVLLITALFTPLAVGTQADISTLKNKLYATATVISSTVQGDLTQRGYFTSNPLKAGKTVGAISVALFFLLFFGAHVLGTLVLIGAVLATGIALLFARIMPSRTASGVAAKENLEGLKLYITTAEADRIKMMQSPDAAYAANHAEPTKTVDLFEKLLPYAMIFGVEKQWAKQFEGIYQAAPNWYAGNYAAFNVGYLASSLGEGMQSTVNQAFSSPSSSGSSGFGGGGFSGGGGGGGGGGGW